MNKPEKPEKMRDKPESPAEPTKTESVRIYRTPSNLEKYYDYAEASEEERLEIIKNNFTDYDDENYVRSEYYDKVKVTDLDLSDPEGPEELYWPDTIEGENGAFLGEILKNLPDNIDPRNVHIVVETYSRGCSDSYPCIEAFYEKPIANYDNKIKEYKEALKQHEKDLIKWKEDKKKKTEENKKYRADMKKYKAWREGRIKELEDKGEL
jgi:succinate dehydrogenase flavin-adding protein (antitoxin of CptAB toxin-antitoxin module)